MADIFKGYGHRCLQMHQLDGFAELGQIERCSQNLVADSELPDRGPQLLGRRVELRVPGLRVPRRASVRQCRRMLGIERLPAGGDLRGLLRYRETARGEEPFSAY